MPPASRPPNLKIKSIPSYILPRPHPPLLDSIKTISPTWRSSLLSSIPPNLADWFIPRTNPNHWEVYKPPIFAENEGKWRFEYKTAFAHILAQFNEEFIDSFKSITGIKGGSGWNGMYDIKELIDCIENFIERVKEQTPSPSPTPCSQTRERYRNFIPPAPHYPRRNLRLECLRSIQVQETLIPSPIPLPEQDIVSSPSSGSGDSRFSRMFGGWLQPRAQNPHQREPEPGPPTQDTLEDGKTSQEDEVERQPQPAELTHVLKRYPRIERESKEEERDGRRIRNFQEWKRRRNRNRNPLPKLKTYPGVAFKAVLASPGVAFKAVLTTPGRLHRQWTRIEGSEAYYHLVKALQKRRRGIIKNCNQASKAIITSPRTIVMRCDQASKSIIISPKKMIQKCGNLLHFRKQPKPQPEPVEVEPSRDKYRRSSLTPSERARIKDWEEGTRCIPMTRRRPPPSFEYDYPVTGPYTKGRESPIVPKPARPDTPIDPTIVEPSPRRRSPLMWVPPPGGPPNEFRDFMKGIGWPV